MPRVTITVIDNVPQPYRFPLDRQKVTLGRGSENDITIHCASVSVSHAVMERKEGFFSLRDLGSTNGTFVDGVKQANIALKDGDSVKLGDVSFDFQLSEEERVALASEQAEEHEEKVAKRKSGEPVAQRAKAPKAAPSVVVSTGSPLQSMMMIFCFLFLAALAFYIGLSMRHQKETGDSLLESISQKGKTPKPAEAPKSAMPADSMPAEAESP